MKTLKQIADEIGIDKQKVYRFVKKNCINEVHQKNGVMYYDEVAESKIKQGFASKEVHQESASSEAVIDVLLKQSETLQKELDIKNQQIANLQKLLDQEQQLRMVTEQKLLLLEEKQEEEQNQQPEEKQSFWSRLWHKGN